MTNTNAVTLWPPLYNLRVNRRSKRIHLQISPKKGLQIVVPKPSDKTLALDFLNSKRQWVEKQLAKITVGIELQCLPTEIKFLAINRDWRVIYEKIPGKKTIQIIVKPNEIVLLGNTDNIDLCQKILVDFVRRQAEKHLIPWLGQLSIQCNLPFKDITIRQQQSRWGSCSSKKNINLNSRLLFLPTPWVEYVLVHELSHTIHMDHSARFWQLLASFIPDCLMIRKQLKQAEQYLPWWA